MSVTLAAGCKDKETTLSDVNEFLNDKVNMNMNLANKVAIIPFNHINGPKNEWKFYALVNFQYKQRGYVKYQVTYLSCTCRAAKDNYWSTAYIELSLPSSNNPEDVTLNALSFDVESEQHYVAGFWGDSSPIKDEATQTNVIATYEKMETSPGSGVYYPSIKEDFIPLLIGKTKTEIDTYNTVDEMNDAGTLSDDTYDAFTGASVSTNNILRILHAMFEYHANTWLTNAN
jgi:hypothetical protein